MNAEFSNEQSVNIRLMSEKETLSPSSMLEARFRAQEAYLCKEAKVLELQVQRLKLDKAAAEAARERARAGKDAEAELLTWQLQLRSEVDRAIDRLNDHRQRQLEACAEFEQKLCQNIHDMIIMQKSVRRRAEVLEASFDAAVQRLNGNLASFQPFPLA